jgi:hypothetical protein
MAFPQTVFSFALALVVLAAGPAGAQALVFSTTTDLTAAPHTVYEEELHRFDAGGRWPVLTREMLGMLVGDTDGDGTFDDQPLDVDAAHASTLAEPGSFFLSVTADFNLPDGTQVQDGDVFHFTGNGVAIDLAESFFEGATGTAGVDVDAFAVGPAGEIYFSFAEDESTTNAALIAQNGGIAVLDEQCVFEFVSGAAAATLHLDPAAVVTLFNHAFGATATTVVDVDGVEIDPANPGELLLTSLSTATAFRGKVMTTAGGGSPFVLAGQQIGPAALGLPATASLDALAIVSAPRHPVLRCLPEIVSAATPILAGVESWGWTAGTPVQFVVTDAVLPHPAFVSYPLAAGFTASPLDVTNPLFLESFSVAPWLVTADATGTASLYFGTAGLPVGINAVIQTVDLATGTMSTPAAMAFTP